MTRIDWVATSLSIVSFRVMKFIVINLSGEIHGVITNGDARPVRIPNQTSTLLLGETLVVRRSPVLMSRPYLCMLAGRYFAKSRI